MITPIGDFLQLFCEQIRVLVSAFQNLLHEEKNIFLMRFKLKMVPPNPHSLPILPYFTEVFREGMYGCK
jgi:hypothetical protein